MTFVHRVAAAEANGRAVLFAATVCGGKSHRDDWSRPGCLYAIGIPESTDGPWEPVVVAEGLHRNHGMTLSSLDGFHTLLVTADEGVFAWQLDQLPDRPDASWKPRQLLSNGVSEIGVIDLDGDGADELITVEPFHGDSLCIYKREIGGWKRVSREPLQFGHGLSVGMLGGAAVAVVGNRGGSGDLICIDCPDGDARSPRRTVIDPGVGAAGTAVVGGGASGRVVSANAALGEYALYTMEDE
jgi:hypothetical protein